MCERQATDVENPPPKETITSDAKKRLKMLDDIEDFMDDGSINDANGKHN